jgi:hypothetical protein
MNIRLILRVFVALLIVTLSATSQGGNAGSRELTLLVQGDTARLPDFIESFRRELKENGLGLKVAERGSEYDYNVVLAQETTLGSAAAAVIVLDRNAVFVTSVVRSGRFSGKGAFNASAKELAKKIAILKGVK